MSTTTTEPTACELTEGLHAVEGVRYLAEMRGFPEGEALPDILIFNRGFSEKTAFVKSSNGRGYYRTTKTICTCPSFKFRGGLCKHQKAFIAEVDRREFAKAYSAYLEASKTYENEPLPELPRGVVGMTSAELETRRARIAARNAERRAERATAARVPSTSRGFNQPETLAVAPL